MPKTHIEKSKPKPNDPEQSKRFEETARELELDTSGKTFERAFKTVVPPHKQPTSEERD